MPFSSEELTPSLSLLLLHADDWDAGLAMFSLVVVVVEVFTSAPGETVVEVSPVKVDVVGPAAGEMTRLRSEPLALRRKEAGLRLLFSFLLLVLLRFFMPRSRPSKSRLCRLSASK